MVVHNDDGVRHRTAVAKDRPGQLVSIKAESRADMADTLNLHRILRTSLCSVKTEGVKFVEKSETGGPSGSACRNQSMLRGVSLMKSLIAKVQRNMTAMISNKR